MHTGDEKIWKAKLAAWTHDPPEKPLILFRTLEGHEGGTVRKLREEIFGSEGLNSELAELAKTADHWAAAADRPPYPGEKGGFAPWKRVPFADKPCFIHPLSGEVIQVQELSADVLPDHIKAVSFDHLAQKVARDENGVDWKRTFLSLWRLAPESPAPHLGALWGLLPADGRVPDHSIWNHLSLASAFAGAMAGDPKGQIALFSISFGPVQSFIQQARKMDDLWAGSHLLSRITWEGLKVVCEALGPDAVLYPDLRGVPNVDLWLKKEIGIKDPDGILRWMEEEEDRVLTDSYPVFRAALPNVFVAVVPLSHAGELAGEITRKVRAWVKEKALAALDLLLKVAEADSQTGRAVAARQIEDQLQDFPEVHWAFVPWPGKQEGGGKRTPDSEELEAGLSLFYPEGANSPGFFGKEFWKFIKEGGSIDELSFFSPNGGVFFPAVIDLAEKLKAAAKATRRFSGICQEGYRCSLCGEREWLTSDRGHLPLVKRDRGGKTLWDLACKKDPVISRKGEHLCGLCGLKRFWTRLFHAELEEITGRKVNRFMVTTHAMAVCRNIEKLAGVTPTPAEQSEFQEIIDRTEDKTWAALPRRTARELQKVVDDSWRDQLRLLPAVLDQAMEGEAGGEEDRNKKIEGLIKRISKIPVEKYYGLILLDGDRLGAWLHGDEEFALAFQDTWHPEFRDGINKQISGSASLNKYLELKRPVSPGRQAAISTALNSFALTLGPQILEGKFKGKVVYSGGDDLLGLVALDDLPEAMLALRAAYSGILPQGFTQSEELWKELGVQGGGSGEIRIQRGFSRCPGIGEKPRLMHMMGKKATLSMGVVVAHHKAPLASVLRSLREAESSAKKWKKEKKDAFTIRLLKRSGGATNFSGQFLMGGPASNGTGPDWKTTPLGLLIRLRRALDGPLSRRTAYHLQEWLKSFPPDPPVEMVQSLLAYQFQRHLKKNDGEKTTELDQTLAGDLARWACGESETVEAPNEGGGQIAVAAQALSAILVTAEFLAREGRAQ